MKVVITGGTGFIGRMLARRVLERGALTGPSGGAEPVDEMVLFDAVVPPEFPPALAARAKVVTGEISDRAQIEALIDRDDIAVFHLASVVSAGGEQDFNLAMRVNLDGGRHVLEACRRRKTTPRLVFTSSIAVFGPPGMGPRVDDSTKQTPQTTYGVTKAIGELLVNDYTRKGFLDGRSARLPTVIVRPGRPNKAASSFVSGVIREPLSGEPCRLPVGLETVMPVLGYRSIVENLIRLHEAPGEAIGPDRAVSFPSLDVTVGEMVAALKRVAGGRRLGPIEVAPDPAIERIVAGWPTGTAWRKAAGLGLVCDPDIDSIIRAYIEDFLPG
ncbi:MAG TPA: D-erythronate dehydrogenase [Alphaproteobacteria bacterium]|nr:D-erythronate dehydrogenase [Alphaproteobacteria bacterium]